MALHSSPRCSRRTAGTPVCKAGPTNGRTLPDFERRCVLSLRSGVGGCVPLRPQRAASVRCAARRVYAGQVVLLGAPSVLIGVVLLDDAARRQAASARIAVSGRPTTASTRHLIARKERVIAAAGPRGAVWRGEQGVDFDIVQEGHEPARAAFGRNREHAGNDGRPLG